MKTKKKALLIFACAVLLVAASVFGTLSYLTDKDAVVNTFTVGKVSIDLDEAKVNTDGQPLDKDGKVVTDVAAADRVKANNYHLLPGSTYVKDPTVTVMAGSEEAYVRMFVEVQNIDKLEATFPIEKFGDKYYGTEIKNGVETKVFLLQTLVEGWNGEVWKYAGYKESADDKTGTYEFRYYTTVDTSDSTTDKKLEALFGTITVPGEDVTSANINNLSSVKIVVTAQAIQASGFTNADAAWAVFR